MTAPNHIVGGFTVTGIFAAIGGINILQDYRLLPVILLGALLPDIDTTKSVIGRLVKPVAKIINQKYGHRTITHSLIALIGLTAVVSAFQAAYFPGLAIAQVFGLAYASHLLLDMVTVQGIPLFYPFSKNPCVLPGNPQMRLRTNSLRHETMAFCIFVVSAIFMKPLFADGFWTSYNRLFGTMEHLTSEYHKSEDLLKVNFTIQRGSEIKQQVGLCVEASASKMTIITKQKTFETYPQDGQMISDIYPEHTKYQYKFAPGSFHDITVDSLHRLFGSGKYSRIEVQGTEPFLYLEDQLKKKGSVMKMDYPNRIRLKAIEHDTSVDYTTNPSIQHKQDQIIRLQSQHSQAMADYRQQLNQYEDLKHRMEQATDHIRKELLMIEYQKAKAPTLPKSIDDKIRQLQSDIEQLNQADGNQYREQLKAAEKGPLLLSGHYVELVIEGVEM